MRCDSFADWRDLACRGGGHCLPADVAGRGTGRCPLSVGSQNWQAVLEAVKMLFLRTYDALKHVRSCLSTTHSGIVFGAVPGFRDFLWVYRNLAFGLYCMLWFGAVHLFSGSTGGMQSANQLFPICDAL